MGNTGSLNKINVKTLLLLIVVTFDEEKSKLVFCVWNNTFVLMVPIYKHETNSTYAYQVPLTPVTIFIIKQSPR